MSRWDGVDRRFNHARRAEDQQRALEHYQGELDRLQGQFLREALQKAGPGGRVVVTQLHDEILFTVENKA
ncbi:hypothetical protein Xoosp2_75 [Xanthomonas phage Xoo-sp2]|uniref:Uncharacterized protein n=1 Tax=Xanthomonas phage Xoo-sp2 TaxID=1852622 RepID=A0A1X9IAT2_9CAUD|nr:hypothetical protein JTY55_gp75 [Xanthomonas phage Xoo-sp2]ANT45297.1 hypothetical protein Xoosp2_75 [Xanthomonas phage Xoo-sp2]